MTAMKFLLAIVLLFAQTQVFADGPFRRDVPLAAYRFMECFTKRVEEEKGLVLVAKVADVDPCEDKITGFRLEFDFFGHPSIDDVRRLIISVLDGFLNAINTDQKIAPYLATFPFTPEDVDIRIEFRTQECDKFYPYLGNIAYVMAYDGRIVYNTLNSYNYHVERYKIESYGEAKYNLSR